MPSVHKSHYAEDQVNGPPSAYHSPHRFLPSLPRQIPNHVPSTSGHFRLVQSNSWAPTSTNNDPRVLSSTPSAPNAVMTSSDEAEQRFERKKQQARRQLMDGLTPSHLNPSTELPRRTHSFIVRPDHGDLNNESGRSNLDSLWRQRHSSSQLRPVMSFAKRSSIPYEDQNGSRAKIAIQTWNELVEELNRRKESMQLNNLDHLAILSDKASNDSFDSPVKHDSSLRNGQSQAQTVYAKTVHKLAEDFRKEGLGYTRYRPITPKFLAGLDRKKLPSRTLTQLWVNQLPDNHRSYRVTRPGLTFGIDEAACFEKHKS